MHNTWTKSGSCLYRYNATGIYFARVRFGGKLHRRSLRTTDFAFAKRKLAEFKADLGRTDPKQGNTSFGAVLDRYARTLGGLKPSTRQNKLAIIAELKRTWRGLDSLPLRSVRPSDVSAWLSKHSGQEFSASHYNQRLTLIRDAMQMALDDRVIADSPVRNIEWRNPPRNIQRPTPTWEQFEAIVKSIRSQKFNGHDADESADFVEFLGLAGLGQAEASAFTWDDINWKREQIVTFRHKTKSGFSIPLYPQLRPLLEKRHSQRRPGEDHVFTLKNAKRAIESACKRLKLPAFTHRSFRRMFITTAIERGVDVKVIAEWQGHKDGGKLILDTYSHVNRVHSQRMAQLMTTERPENVIPLRGATA